jgi:hypothetical protein
MIITVPSTRVVEHSHKNGRIEQTCLKAIQTVRAPVLIADNDGKDRQPPQAHKNHSKFPHPGLKFLI